jgi:small subunit ribosomal protein S6
VKKEGASTREGIEQEIAAAEAKRTQASVEGGTNEGRVIHQIEKASAEAKPSISSPKKTYNKEEISTKGE